VAYIFLRDGNLAMYKWIKNSLLNFSLGCMFVIVSSDPSVAQSTTPLTWEQYLRKGGFQYFVRNGRHDSDFVIDYDFPREFRNGYVYPAYLGPSGTGFYLLKSSLPSYPSLDLRSLSSAGSSLDWRIAEEYVNAGKAISVFTHINNYRRRFESDTDLETLVPGQGCFQYTCLNAGPMSMAHIRKILLSSRRIDFKKSSVNNCISGNEKSIKPSNEKREIRLEKYNILFEIPKNYRTRTFFDATLSRVDIYEPSLFDYGECLVRNQIPTDGTIPPIMINIRRSDGGASLVDFMMKHHNNGRNSRIDSVEGVSGFRTAFGVQEVLKYKYTIDLGGTTSQYQSVIFLLPGKANFIEISHDPSNSDSDISWGSISTSILASLKPIKDSGSARPNLTKPPRSFDKPVAIQQKLPGIRPRDALANPPISTVSQRPSIQEIALINQQTGSQQSPPQLNQIQRQARQTLQQQTSKYLSPFVGSWRTTDNQTIFIYPSTRKGKERQACIIIEKDNTQDLQIGVATGNATGTDINIGRSRLFNIKQPNTLALRNPGSNQLVAVYAAPESPSLTENNRSSMEDNGCITSFPSTAIATAPTNSSFQPRKTFPNIKAFGLDQFIQSNQTFANVPLDLEKAKQGQYTIPKLPKLDLLTEPLTDIPEEAGKFLGSRKQITLEDYLTLKLKVNQQGLLLLRTVKSLETAEKYLEQFPKDGQNQHPVVTNISSRFWKAVEQDGGSKKGLGDRLIYAIEESRVATGGFIQETAKTGFAAFKAWRDLGEWIELLPKNSIQQRGLGLSAELMSNQEYLSSVNSALSEILESSKSGDLDKVNRRISDLATTTLKWLNEIPEIKDKSKATSQGKLLLEIRASALQLKETTDLLGASSTKDILNEFDRAYLTAASIDSAVNMVSTLISSLAPEKALLSAITKKADAVRIVLVDAIKFTYKDDIRRQYQALQAQEKINQKMINELSSAFDFSGEEIGTYLLRNRADVLRRTKNGVIEVSIKETVYPRR
jgi:hypothetical protein